MQPFNLEKASIKEKETACYLGTQWNGIKNHKKFIPQLSKIIVPVRLYGCGIEYYYTRKTDAWQESINLDHLEGIQWNEDSIHNYYGYVDYNDALIKMSKCRMSIDLSTNGCINMTH